MTNPVADGIPVRDLPPEVFGKPRDPAQTIPMSLLGQAPPPVYRLGPGDILGVWIENVLGDRNQPPPVHITDLAHIPPAVGYPVPVREDGTVSLPLIEPIQVNGMSMPEAEDAIRRAYIAREILKQGKDRVLVTLMRKRTYHVLVIRQETGNFTSGPDALTQISAPLNKLGNGHVLELPAYENDVLNALARSGGLPGLDAYDAVRIERAAFYLDSTGTPHYGPEAAPGPAAPCPGPRVVTIPLRVLPGHAPPIRPEDVVLHSGDTVFIEERSIDYFYTGGLLPPGEFQLPRDRDLDVVKAISFVKGPLVNGAFGGSNLSGNLIEFGWGGPSPSLLTVIRQLPNGEEVRIRVDLNRALRDPRERILVQPRDVLILQQKPAEALARYLAERLDFTIVWQVFRTSRATGTFTSITP
jgi:protein involved in polysaccharide export with SLBB domain